MKTIPKHTNLFFSQYWNIKNVFQSLVLLVLMFFSVLMFLIVFKYLPVGSENNFLLIKQTEVQSVKGYLLLFYIHVFSAGLALPAGFTQFSSFILTKRRKLHRAMGYLYVVSILLLAAPSGFFIGIYANGGLVAKTSFIILSILWFFFTYKGLLTAKRKDFNAHRNYMIRSYALTISALTLRMWKVIIVWLWHPAPMDTYVVISILGWVPNFLLAEFLIANKKSKTNIHVQNNNHSML